MPRLAIVVGPYTLNWDSVNMVTRENHRIFFHLRDGCTVEYAFTLQGKPVPKAAISMKAALNTALRFTKTSLVIDLNNEFERWQDGFYGTDPVEQ